MSPSSSPTLNRYSNLREDYQGYNVSYVTVSLIILYLCHVVLKKTRYFSHLFPFHVIMWCSVATNIITWLTDNLVFDTKSPLFWVQFYCYHGRVMMGQLLLNCVLFQLVVLYVEKDFKKSRCKVCLAACALLVIDTVISLNTSVSIQYRETMFIFDMPLLVTYIAVLFTLLVRLYSNPIRASSESLPILINSIMFLIVIPVLVICRSENTEKLIHVVSLL